MDDNPFGPLTPEEIARAPAEQPSARPGPVPIVPVPDDAPPMDFEHREFGKPHRAWPYHDAEGRVMGYVCRWDFPDDREVRKEIWPVTYCDLGDGTRGWRARGIPAPRPLFNLPQVLAKPDAVVIITEGEKSCEAAARLFPDMVATTTMHGAQSPGKTDFTPLAGRTVIIATDHDDAGRHYGDEVFGLLRKAGAEIILHLRPEDMALFIWRDGQKLQRPSSIPKGWDLANALDEGWSAETLRDHIEAGDLFQDYQPSSASIVTLGRKFRLTAFGLEYLMETKGRKGEEPRNEWIWLSSPLEILARTRNPDGEGWGLLLRVTDADGRTKDWIMPRSMLADDGIEYRRHLSHLGLELASGKWAQAALQEYLGSVRPDGRAITVQTTGWHDDAFVLPHRTIAPNAHPDPIIYQGQEALADSYAASGVLEVWKEKVAGYAVGNSRLAFSVSVALVGPLLEPMRSESGGFHLRGPSSIGKTTAVLLAGSVWGGDEFPANWRATANGLEGIAASRSDTLLVLDEIGQCSGREVGEVVYMLGNGVGKQRANRSGEPRPPKRWRSSALSTGEVSITDKMREDSRTRQSKAGQEVRFVDMPADAGQGLGLFETLHGFPSAEALARHLKAACAENHGHAGVAFLERLVADRTASVAFVTAQRDAFVAAHCPAGADGQVQRVAVRFGLVAAAGELAVHFGNLPWPKGEAARAAAVCFRAWIVGRGGTESHEVRTAVEQVRHFIELNGDARFEHLGKKYFNGDKDEKKPVVRDRAGYRVSTFDRGDVYCIYPEVFRKEVCRGLDPLQVARILAEKGMLNRGSSNRLERQRRVPGSETPQRFYEVNAKIFAHGLDDDDDDDDPDPDPATTAQETAQRPTTLFADVPRRPALPTSEQLERLKSFK